MANVNLAQVVIRNALRRIGKRKVVDHGWNGMPMYADRVGYPFPVIRFKEPIPDVLTLREKEKGDWKLSMQEKKALYRASSCQIFSKIKFPTGEWKMYIGLIAISMSIATMLLMKAFVYDKIPETFNDEHQKAHAERMLDFNAGLITGLSSKWDYENNSYWGVP